MPSIALIKITEIRLILYVTESVKIGLVAHDSTFDFASQTQSFMNTLSNFKIKITRGMVVVLNHSGEQRSGTLIEP